MSKLTIYTHSPTKYHLEKQTVNKSSVKYRIMSTQCENGFVQLKQYSEQWEILLTLLYCSDEFYDVPVKSISCCPRERPWCCMIFQRRPDCWRMQHSLHLPAVIHPPPVLRRLRQKEVRPCRRGGTRGRDRERGTAKTKQWRRHAIYFKIGNLKELAGG